MFKSMTMALVSLTTIGALGAATAEAGMNPLRCEARRAGCDKKYFRCLGRCDDGATQSFARPAQTAEQENDCVQACERSRQRDDEKINSTPPCAARPVQPDPNECEVQLLSVRRAFLVRAANCMQRSAQRDNFDLTACENGLDVWCATRVDEVLSRPICRDGRAGTTPICGMP